MPDENNTHETVETDTRTSVRASKLDYFTTRPETVKECLEYVDDLDSFDVAVEPAAGRGAFSSQIENCYAFDLHPQHKEVVEKDWFDVTTEDFGEFSTMLVIGAPPFGKNDVLARDFIEHGVSIGATTIAFILSKRFIRKMKRHEEVVFDSSWELVREVDLGQRGFDLDVKGELYVPCGFQVWTRTH